MSPKKKPIKEKFHYTARTKKMEFKKGELTAESVKHAIDVLEKRGLHVYSIKKASRIRSPEKSSPLEEGPKFQFDKEFPQQKTPQKRKPLLSDKKKAVVKFGIGCALLAVCIILNPVICRPVPSDKAVPGEYPFRIINIDNYSTPEAKRIMFTIKALDDLPKGALRYIAEKTAGEYLKDNPELNGVLFHIYDESQDETSGKPVAALRYNWDLDGKWHTLYDFTSRRDRHVQGK